MNLLKKKHKKELKLKLVILLGKINQKEVVAEKFIKIEEIMIL
jgi:hypothetical protein